MPQQLSNALDLMKTDYIGGVQELLNSKNRIYGMIQKVHADGSGELIGASGPYPSGTQPPKTVNFNVHLGRNATGGFQSLEAPYVTAANERYRQGLMQGRSRSWPARLSTAVVERTRTDAVAFARMIAEAAVRTGKSIMDFEESMILGDGSGTIGVVTGVPAVAANAITITLDNFQDVRKFHIGMFCNFWTARTAGATQRTAVTGGGDTGTTNILVVDAGGISISGSTATVRFVAINAGTITATNIAAGDVITKANNNNTAEAFNAGRRASVRNTPMGLLGICLDCDTPLENGETIQGLFGINASTQYAPPSTATAGGGNLTRGEISWQAYNSRSATGRALNNAHLQSVLDMPSINFGEMPNLLITSYGARFEYVNTLTGIRRAVNTIAVSGDTGGGFKENVEAGQVPEFGGLPVYPSRYAPTYPVGGVLCASVLAVNMNYIKVHEWTPMTYENADGLTWRLVPASGGGYSPFLESIMKHTYEILTTARNAHAAVHAILASDFT